MALLKHILLEFEKFKSLCTNNIFFNKIWLLIATVYSLENTTSTVFGGF